MFSLQIQIRNLTNRDDQSLETLHQITVRFGSIQTEIQILNGSGGKKMLLEMDEQQMHNLMKNYAFGLFSRTSESKYFSLLSLEKLKLSDSHQNHQIYFFNEHRNICFQSQICIQFKPYQPRVPKQIQPPPQQKKIVNKPPVPQPPPQITSFLYGQSSQQKPKKPPTPPTKAVKAEAQPTKVVKKRKQERKIKMEGNELENSDEHYIPPVMEFTNNDDEQLFHVPAVSDSLGDEEGYKREKMRKKENNYIIQNASSQEEKVEKQIKKKKAVISRQELREEARKEAEKQVKKQQNIMIPISKGNTLELVPLSSLNENEIIAYAQQQKFMEEQKRREEKLRKQLQEEKKKKKAMERIPETERKKSSEVKKEEVIKEESEEEPDYESDFDSLSLGNSLIRSRHSISNYMNSQKKEENESIFESGYSQDFESYSHSMLSNKKRTNSISEISESMKSISQSYRRP